VAGSTNFIEIYNGVLLTSEFNNSRYAVSIRDVSEELKEVVLSIGLTDSDGGVQVEDAGTYKCIDVYCTTEYSAELIVLGESSISRVLECILNMADIS